MLCKAPGTAREAGKQNGVWTKEGHIKEGKSGKTGREVQRLHALREAAGL